MGYLALFLVLFVMAPVAILALAWVATRFRAIERRIERLETSRGTAAAPRATPVPPPRRARADGAAPRETPLSSGPPSPAPPTAAPQAPGAAGSAPRPTRDAPRIVTTPPAAARPRRDGPGLEERLGARLPVWIAAVALTLSGVFLVKWSFDRGLLGPTMRVALGTAFGLGLLTFGQVSRRRLGTIASATVAAGIGVLYASFLAGTSLYGLIPAPVGFALVAAVTFAAVALSLQHGPIIALVGMVGGFVTPALIGTEDPRPAPLFVYLLLLHAGLLMTLRRRGWWALSPLAALASLGWVWLWLHQGLYASRDAWILGPYLVATLALTAFARAESDAEDGSPWRLGAPGTGRPSAPGVWIAGVGSVLLAAELTRLGPMTATEWSFFAIVGLGCLLLAHFEARFELLAWFAPLTGALLLLIESFALPGQPAAAVSLAESRLAVVAVVLGALFSGGSLILTWVSERPAWRAAHAAAAAALFVLVTYVALDGPSRTAWTATGALLAVLFSIAALTAARRLADRPARDGTLAAFIAAASGFAAFALAVALSRASIGVAWSLEAVALAALYLRFRLQPLRVMTAVVGACVALRLLANPLVFDYPLAAHPLFNWLPYGYGVPIAAAIAIAVLLRSAGGSVLPRWFDGGACALSFALATLLVRHAWKPSLDMGLFPFDAALKESAAYSIAWLALAGVGLLAARRFEVTKPVTSVAGHAAGAAGVAATILLSGIVINPVFFLSNVGAIPVFNWLLVIYGVPALLMAGLGALLHRDGYDLSARFAGGAGLVALFLLVTLEVRQAFRGAYLSRGSLGDGEMYAYSAAWLLFGLALLVAGIARRSLALRYASLAVMSLTVFKVFLVDTGELRDLYRVVSYFGLGVSLLLLAWIYQRFVVGAARR